MTSSEYPIAIALVRRDIPVPGVDLYELAERHGYRLVFTVCTDTGPTVTALVVAQHIGEWNARAVIVPGFEHADSVRQLITGLAALVTPMQRYPRGYRWAGDGRRRAQPIDG